MKITEIVATVGQTIQVKQYEPRSYQSTVKIGLDEGDSPDEALKLARQIANDEVRDYFTNLGKAPEQPEKEVEKPLTPLMPEIITQPNIPKPLHGIAPRTIKGITWWNKTRKKVYEENNYCCKACGVHKDQARGKKWMEAHELWDINYDTGVTTIKDIVPLCHYCHNFIHSGRLTAIVGKEKTVEEVKNILEHGFDILAKAKLQCFPGTLELAKIVGADTKGVTAYDTKHETEIKWEDWKVVFEGKEYKSLFKNFEEWEAHYNKLNGEE